MAIKSSNQITFTEQKKIVEIREWYLATSQNTGVTIDTEGWTTDIQTIDYDHKYLWNYEEIVYSIGSSDISEPVIIGFYGEGRGISDIINYYQITQDLIVPDITDTESWSTTVPLLSPTNKYLWNYEAIIYTNGTVTTTEPALIGVYGDSGTDAVTFEIYSTQGFIFKENMEGIELKIASFQGADIITDATYTWEWWDDTINDGNGGYSIILEGTESKSLFVNVWDTYAFAHLKCIMTYDGNIYEDYVDLINETVIYSSSIKFFDGSNIFNSDVPYLVAYVNLYRNNVLVDSILTDKYYGGDNSVTDGIITTDMSDVFEDGDLVYFIYKENNRYYAVLGKYQSNVWIVCSDESEYVYKNDIYNDINSKIIVISKEDVSKSREINFEIFKKQQDDNGNYIYDEEIRLSVASAMVIDINDPIISPAPPENANYGQLWLDTSSTPYMLYVYTQIEGLDSGEWKYFSQQNGGAVYTSKPSQYFVGDLWILAEGETCESFGTGSMLKSVNSSDTFNSSDWIDADEEMTELRNNINQYFEFNKNTGLKIGQTDEKFYVNISSTEMGFYDNSTGQNQKVVSISNNSATIKNLTVNDNATFNCNSTFNQQVRFGNFVWKTESNGSLSLAII